MQLSVVIHRSSNFLRNNISSSSPLSSSPALLISRPGDFPDIGSLKAQLPSSYLCTLIYALFIFDVFLLHLSTFSRFSTALTAGYPSAFSSLFYTVLMNVVHCLMFISEGRIFKWKLSGILRRQMWKPKTLIGRGAGPASGSAMKGVFEEPKMRHTLHLWLLLAASTFLVVSGRRKDPLWLHKRLHSRLLALYSYVVRRLGANKADPVADA